jgi:hypothetical protein
MKPTQLSRHGGAKDSGLTLGDSHEGSEADPFAPSWRAALERQRRQIARAVCGGRTDLWELRRLFHNRQKLPARIPYAEISTAESFAAAWPICRVVILSNLARAKFRLHGLSQRIFPLGHCLLCRGPPLKGVLLLALPKAFDLQGQAMRPFMTEHATIRRTDVLCGLTSSNVTNWTDAKGDFPVNVPILGS